MKGVQERFYLDSDIIQNVFESEPQLLNLRPEWIDFCSNLNKEIVWYE